jgi:nucleotide-binding universal stress UspA family protein
VGITIRICSWFEPPASGYTSDMPLERILAGVDGSAGAQHALRWAADLAVTNRAHVYVVHVVSNAWLVELGALQLDSKPVIRRAHVDVVGKWTDVLRESGVEYSTSVLVGNAATELLESIDKCHADLVVLGASRHSGLRDELLGGTAHRVVNRSHVPVVVVPLPKDDTAPAWVPIPG